MIRGVPYDAEIEYLESTGTQYIDSGIAPNLYSDVIDCRLVVTSVATYGTAFGIYENSKYFGVRRNGNSDMWQVLWGGLSHTLELDTLYDIHYEYGTNKCYINDTTGSSNNTYQYTNTLYLFALNNGPNAGLFNKMRQYPFSIKRSGVRILDLIPVRVGQVGYMYDRVSRKLFGNSGTGSFVLGPDVATPVMGLRKFNLP